MPKDSLSPKPIPPPGYEIQNLPDFLKPSNAKTKTVAAPPLEEGSGHVIADVDPAQPTTIQVRDPNLFTQPTQTHESTHVFQLSRNAPFVAGMSRQFQQAPSPTMFDYGGMDGLIQAQNTHKTIANYTPEQQARMVQDFQQKTQDAIRGGDRATLAKVARAYQPFVGQLANIPPAGTNMKKMTRQDLTPPAPGLPPPTVAGAPMLPSKLIGGTGLEPNRAITQSYQGKTVPGLVSIGNIDITNRPNVPNPQTGGNSSVWSTSFGTEKGEVLVPRITNGEDGLPPHILSDKIDRNTHTSEAIDYYNKYGKYLGIFKDPDTATAYAQKLHEDQQKYGSTPKTVQQLKQEAAQRNSSVPHKIGEKKRFPNDKIGVWDGHGWVAQ